MMKKLLPIAMGLSILLSITGCNSQSKTDRVETNTETKTSNQEVVTLRFSHLWPATAAMPTEGFEPWAKKIEADSHGRLKVELYPSATLSKPQTTYDAVSKGTVDIGLQVQGYMNGRFPLTQIAELPGLSSSATQMSCILQTLYDDGVVSSEYQDTHLLFMIGSEPSTIHTIDKPIKVPDDLRGLRIRRPSAIGGYIIESAGGSPVGLPATDLYASLERGVVDGMAFPWSPTGSFRLTELVKTHTNMPFYSSALSVSMNKKKYEGLPDDLKKVIDDNSGQLMAKKTASIFDTQATKFYEEAKARGDVMVDIPDPLNDPNWKAPLEAGTQKYLADVEAMGLDAKGVFAKAKEASVACKQ